MGIAVEGSTLAWPGAAGEPSLPQFDVFNQQRFYIDIFNRGKSPFTFTVTASAPWIVLSESQGKIIQEKRIWISVDWRRTREGLQRGNVRISSNSGQSVTVMIDAFHPATPAPRGLEGFVEGDGYVSIEAEHYTKKADGASAHWEKIADLGRTASSMTIFPVTAVSPLPGQHAPCLEYRMYLFHAGSVTVETMLDPTLNFVPGRGLRYAIAFDDETPQVIDTLAGNNTEAWATSVRDSVRKSRSTHGIASPGYHTLNVWMVDPGVVLQKLVIDLGGVKPSYLGPPESYHHIRSGTASP